MAWCFSTRASAATVLSTHPCVSSCLWVIVVRLRHLASEILVTIFSVMMTSSNGNIFHVTGPLWGEFTGDRWIPLTKVSDAELWCFRWSAPQQTVEFINRDTGDLRCHWAYCDVTVMVTACCQFSAKPLKDPMLEDCNSLVFCNKRSQSMDFTRTFVTKSYQNCHALHLIEQHFSIKWCNSL